MVGDCLRTVSDEERQSDPSEGDATGAAKTAAEPETSARPDDEPDTTAPPPPEAETSARPDDEPDTTAPPEAETPARPEHEPDTTAPPPPEAGTPDGEATGLLGKLRRGIAGVDAMAVHVATVVRHGVIMPVLVGLSLASLWWAHKHEDRLHALGRNVLSKQERDDGVLFAVVATAICLLVWGAVAGFTRWWRAAPVIPVMQRLNRLLCFAAMGPFIVLLRIPKFESNQPIVTALYAGVCGAFATPSVAALVADGTWGESRWQRRLSAAGKWLGPFAAMAVAVGYGYLFSRWSVTNHHGLITRVTDLGYYDNIFYQSLHGRPLGLSFVQSGYHGSAHFDPLLVVLSPLYRFYPRAEMLLVLQAAWCGAGAIAAYLIGKRQLQSELVGVTFALVWAVYPALHGANMYEFHSLTLAATPLLFALHFLLAGQLKRYFATLVILLLVREDIPLLMCFVGAAAIVSKDRPAVRAGWITIAVSLAYFVVVKKWAMTSDEMLMEGKFAYYYREMIPKGESFSGLVTTAIMSPAYAFSIMLREAKLEFVLKLLVPLLFLPLFVRRGLWIMLLYGGVFLLLATREYVFSTHFQYSCVSFPLLIGLSAVTLRDLRDRAATAPFGFQPRQWAAGLAGGMLVASLVCSWKFGGITENSSFRGGFAHPRKTLTPPQREKHRRLREMVDRIPPGASVTTTNRIGAHVSNREKVHFYRQGKITDFVLIHTSDLRSWTKTWHQRRVARKELVLLDSHQGVQLFRLDPDKVVHDAKAQGEASPTPPKRPSPRSKPGANDDDGGREGGGGSGADATELPD